MASLIGDKSAGNSVGDDLASMCLIAHRFLQSVPSKVQKGRTLIRCVSYAAAMEFLTGLHEDQWISEPNSELIPGSDLQHLHT